MTRRSAPDYRRFLASATPAEEQVLPYFGGPFVETTGRRLRVAGDATRPAPGFWRFEVRGRVARPLAPADPPDLSDRPSVRGYSLESYLVGIDGAARQLAIAAADQPPRFAPLVARRWPTGELVFDTLDFETGIEDRVREAYRRRRPLRGESGIPAALRAAFGYAVLLRAAAERGIPARPAEALTRLGMLADEGDAAAFRLLDELEAARRAAGGPAPAGRVGSGRMSRHAVERTEERIAEVLRAAGAALRDIRWLAGGLVEVRYDCAGECFTSVVDRETLQVVDAGVCLSGEDRQLTLESLPSVLREAMSIGALHITAW